MPSVKPPQQKEVRTFRVTIDSVLGGISQLKHFARADQFNGGMGIDPGMPISDGLGEPQSGLLRPMGMSTLTTSLNNIPMWIEPTPKDNNLYVCDAQGSAYTVSAAGGFAALSDGGSLSSGSGNGEKYYDNYIYIAKNTDIARYGPLDGAPTFNGTYWTGTLGKAALSNTTYPTQVAGPGASYPNHVMHRHSDGKLYIADVVGNQGVIHMISTTKAAVEGDTDAGSTYQKLSFGYGLYPMAMESYGSTLVIALYEGQTGLSYPRLPAKLAFWDTNSQNFNNIIFVEFPDGLISGLKNLNGTLYIVSGEVGSYGFRVTRYIGGNSIEDVLRYAGGMPPLAGALCSDGNRLYIGSVEILNYGNISDGTGVVHAVGIGNTKVPAGLFPAIRAKSTVTALCPNRLATVTSIHSTPIVGWGSTGSPYGINLPTGGTSYSNNPAWWQSQIYKIGQRFKITKLTILLPETGIQTNRTLTPTFNIDSPGNQKALTQITSATFGATSRRIVIRPQNLTGENYFQLELQWGGTSLLTVGLPIVIEGEYIDD